MKKLWLKAGEFTKLKHDEIESLEETQLKAYQEELYAHLEGEKEALKSQIKSLEEKGSGNENELKALKEKFNKIDVEAHGELSKTVKEIGLAVSKLMTGDLSSMPTTVKSQIMKFVSDNATEIKALKEQGHGFLEFATKAVGSLTTGSALNPDGIPELVGVEMAPPTNVNLRASIVDPLVNTFPTTLPAFPYTETVPKDGDFAFVAEGTIKPQIDFKIETRYAEPVKCASYEILTEESVQDIPNLQSIATNFLKAKHDLKRQNGILFGDGISPNPTGATTYGRVFVAGAMALAVTDTNFMDVVNACITDIYTTHNYQDEMPYLANLVMVNPVDFYIQLVSAKDANGLPLYPTAGLFNRVVIGGVTIIPFEDIPSGKIFVGDMSKYNVSNYIGYTVKIGWINDQLITNHFTMVGESRFHAFVKKLDEQAFIYDDIATIATAITAI